MKPSIGEFQFNTWLIFPVTALELSSGHKPVYYMVHQQPDASEVSKTSCFRQMLYNIPSVLLLNANGRKWLRPERPENYLLRLCDHPFYPNMFWHNFGEPMLCLLGSNAAFPILESHGPWNASGYIFKRYLCYKNVQPCVSLGEEMISRCRAEWTSLLMLANLTGCSPTETERTFDESKLQRVNLICTQLSGTNCGCTLGSWVRQCRLSV